MNPESFPSVPMLPRSDRPAAPVPGRRPADVSTEPGAGSGERRDDAASFGDTIARARRDAEQQAATRTRERTARDGDLARNRAQGSTENARDRAGRGSGAARDAGNGDVAARDRTRNGEGTARDAAQSRRTGRGEGHDAAARSDATIPASPRPPDDASAAAAAAGLDTVATEVADTPDSEPALPAAVPEPAASTASATAPVTPSIEAPLTLSTEAPLTPSTEAPLTPSATTATPVASSPGQAADAIGSDSVGGDPPGEVQAAGATHAPHDALAAASATTADRLAHAATRRAPGPARGTAADPPDPLAASTGTASDAAAAAGTPASETVAGDAFSQQAAAAIARLASGDAAERFGQHGAGMLATAGSATAGTHAQPAPAPGLQPATTSIPTPLTHSAFANHFAGEVASLAFRGIELAEIVLNPKELGPVRIELSLSGETARIAFSAAQPETRHAIEQTLPILEDMLADHGLLLSDASVADGHAGREPGDKAGAGRERGAAASTHETRFEARNGAGFAGPVGRAAAARGLVDLYA